MCLRYIMPVRYKLAHKTCLLSSEVNCSFSVEHVAHLQQRLTHVVQQNSQNWVNNNMTFEKWCRHTFE